MADYEALLIISFGGPEGPDDVMPFLSNVTRGRNIPPSRLRDVEQRYLRRGGVSPINEQCRRLIDCLHTELADHAIDLPIYWGNRNWHPMLADTIAAMAADGVENAVALVTSAYSSYPSCRQYLDDIEKARADVGASAPHIEKIRPYFDHPGFVEPFARSTSQALDELGELGELGSSADRARLVFTAHSIPTSMAAGCDYEQQLREVARLVADRQEIALDWELVWQSRSGAPTDPWLEPDVNDHVRQLATEGVKSAVIVPIGFVFDHMEVVFDLDEEAAATAAEVGIEMRRAETPATVPDPDFVSMCRELIEERLEPGREASTVGHLNRRDHTCPADCCRPT